jgi:small ligand-binding sensory domain FIST
MRWASAVSEQSTLESAVDEVTTSVGQLLRGEPVDFAIIFVSRHFAPRYTQIPALLHAKLAPRVLLGCSAGGVIGGGHEVEQRAGFALTAATLPAVAVHPFALENGDLPDADAAPGHWHRAVGVAPNLEPHFVLLADPFSFAAERLVRGLDYAYPRGTKVGGLASGATQPGVNVLYRDREVRRDGAVGVAFSGDIAVATVVAQGCRPIGEPLQITRCQKHVLFELDEQPALEVLQELAQDLTEADRALMSHSLFLGVAMDELSAEPGDYLIRNLMGIDPTHGALAVAEQLRDGQRVQFHLRDARTSAQDLGVVLDRYLATHGTRHARGALLFSCLGRGMHLYGEADHDTNMFRDHVGDVPLGGFFCNGEIGPVSGATHLHGYTSAFGIFSPRRDPAALS